MHGEAALCQRNSFQRLGSCLSLRASTKTSSVSPFSPRMWRSCATDGLRDTVIALLILNWKPLWSGLVCFLSKDYVAHKLGVASLLTTLLLYRAIAPTAIANSDRSSQDLSHEPRIFECRTTHRRLFPIPHSFSYSYLLVGVPLDWHGSIGSILSSESLPRGEQRPRKTWFSVNAEDYLQRAEHIDGLAGKLKDYLRSQHVSPEDYPVIYLVTAPRFCGMSFNPVSFWYLYDKSNRLAAMVLEVNNTFDERRMYLLRRDENEDQSSETQVRFRSRWDKDFHVSPFNDRDGAYTLSAIDPFDPSAKGHLDNTIVLCCADKKPKMVTRVFSVGSPIDPSTMSTMQTYKFVARWWWVGLFTNLRILYQARILWMKKLSLFYRPEVMASSIGRRASQEEEVLEPFFRAFLNRVAESADVVIEYIAAAGPQHGKSVLLSGRANGLDRPQPVDVRIEVKVTTPAFYSELVREPDVIKTVERFCFNPTPGQAMVYVSDPAAFKQLLEGVRPTRCTSQHIGGDVLEYLTNRLRSMDSLLHITVNTIRHFLGLSTEQARKTMTDPLIHDMSKLQQEEINMTLYHRTCVKIFIADRLALGYTWLLRLYVRILRLLMVTVAATRISSVASHGDGDGDVFGVARWILVFGSELLVVCGLGMLVRS